MVSLGSSVGTRSGNAAVEVPAVTSRRSEQCGRSQHGCSPHGGGASVVGDHDIWPKVVWRAAQRVHDSECGLPVRFVATMTARSAREGSGDGDALLAAAFQGIDSGRSAMPRS